MKLSQQPRIGVSIRLKNVAIVTSTVVVLAVAAVFLGPGILYSVDSNASNTSVSPNSTVNINPNPFNNLSSGDTLFIYGKLNVNKTYRTHSDKAIHLVVDGVGAEVVFDRNKMLHFGEGSSLTLRNGGKLNVSNNPNGDELLRFGLVDVAQYTASQTISSFATVNSEGGIDASVSTDAVVVSGNTTTLASGRTISYEAQTSDPFPSLSNNDTLIVKGVLKMNKHYSALQTKALTVVVDGADAELVFNSGNMMKLGSGSSLQLLNGGSLATLSPNQGNEKLFFGSNEVARDNGTGGIPSFDSVNSAGGIDANGAPLPVSWLEVSGNALEPGQIQLQWSTATELNNSHFDVQYSEDGSYWEDGNREYSKAQSGTSLQILYYNSTQYIPYQNGSIYFRIKQTDFDGQYDYSDVFVVSMESDIPVNVATLGERRIRIQLNEEGRAEANVRIISTSGDVVVNEMIADRKTFELPETGVYIIDIQYGGKHKRIKHMVL